MSDKNDSPLLEYELALVKDLTAGETIDKVDTELEEESKEPKPRGGQCYTVVARGFSVPKLVAGLLYEAYTQLGSETRTCSPYLIFLLNFDEVDFRALEINLQWLEETDKRPDR